MARLSPLAPLLLCLILPSTAVSGPSAQVADVNGVRLPYLGQGSGEPIVFVHGAFSDLRVWEPIREEIAKRLGKYGVHPLGMENRAISDLAAICSPGAARRVLARCRAVAAL